MEWIYFIIVVISVVSYAVKALTIEEFREQLYRVCNTHDIPYDRQFINLYNYCCQNICRDRSYILRIFCLRL